MHVRLVAEDAPDGERDVRRRKHRGGHLVEKRLEQVVVLPVHHHHAHRGLRERLCRRDAAEAAADDHHDGFMLWCHRRIVGRRSRRREGIDAYGSETAMPVGEPLLALEESWIDCTS